MNYLGRKKFNKFRVFKGYIVQISQINVTGMTCGDCAQHVTHTLNTIIGVLKVKVKLSDGLVTVQYNEKMTDPMHFKGAIRAAGYGVTNTTI